MTNREKKLLGGALAALALVMAVQYLILPAVKEKAALQDQLETLTHSRELSLSRIHALTYLDDAMETHRRELDALSAPYSPYRSTEEMDGVITKLLLEHDLFPVTLTLEAGKSGTAVPYLEKAKAAKDPYDGISLDALMAQSDVTAAEITQKGDDFIYIGAAHLTAAGTPEAWLSLLDAISAGHPDLRVDRFTLTESGGKTLITATVEFYMREGE